MSLTTALNSSIRALGVAQEGISISSNNVANVDTPGYIKQVADQQSIIAGGIGQGVEITGISSDVDQQLLKSMQDQVSELGMANTLETFFNTVQSLFGQPDAGNSLSSRLDKFFTSFQNLSSNPETASLRLSALNDANGLASAISNLALQLQNTRLDADKQIHSDVTTINGLIEQLYNSNTEIIGFPEGSAGKLGVEQQRTLNLQKLSEYIDLSTTVDSDGTLSILTKAGVTLLDSTGRFKIVHNQVASVNNFINDVSMTAITVAKVRTDGSLNENTSDLASSGQSADVVTNLTGGTLKGLLDVRDNKISEVLDQLDILADALRDQVNTIHNDGTSFPPPASLTGTKTIASTNAFGFNGQVMIAVLNEDGTPPDSPFSDETYYRPLTLDLSTLDSGNGAGYPTVQTIMDEINYYYGPVQNRANVGNMRDIALAVYPDTDSIANQGTVKFDLELDNVSTKDSTIVINSVNIVNAGAYAGLTAPAVPTAGYTVSAGGRERTGVPLTVDFSGGPDLASYTVRVNVTVTDGDGNISTADIDYTIADNVTGVRNDRYNADAVTNVAGTSNFYSAPTSQTYAQASIVDENGDVVAAGENGFLKITTSAGEDFGISIDEMNSEEKGLLSTASSNITHRGFSHFFELNNFFESNGDVLDGSAINMSVRSDIKTNAGLIATGSLQLSNQPTDETTALYTYEIGSGDNDIPKRISDLRSHSISFGATGALPAISTTFGSYTGEITGFVATISLNMTNSQQSELLGLDGLRDLFQKSAGVNSDEELARIIELENNYRASAKIISIVQELFRVLNDTF